MGSMTNDKVPEIMVFTDKGIQSAWEVQLEKRAKQFRRSIYEHVQPVQDYGIDAS